MADLKNGLTKMKKIFNHQQIEKIPVKLRLLILIAFPLLFSACKKDIIKCEKWEVKDESRGAGDLVTCGFDWS